MALAYLAGTRITQGPPIICHLFPRSAVIFVLFESAMPWRRVSDVPCLSPCDSWDSVKENG